MKKKNFLLGFIISIISHTATAQYLHTKTMRLFLPDRNAPIINVYDVNKETLIKSINIGETVMSVSMSFNSDQSKLYAVGLLYANIIDVKTLEVQKIELQSKSSIIGVTEKGISVTSKGNVYDLNNGGKIINTISEKNNSPVLYDGNILYALEDGSISVIDPVTGNTIRKIENAFDAEDLKEAQSSAQKYKDNKTIYPSITFVGKNHFYTELSWMKENKMIMAYALYDATAGTIIHKERPTLFLPEISNVTGISSHNLFQKVIAKTPMPMLVMPPFPDYAKMKVAEIELASKEYPKQMEKAQAEYKIKTDEYNKPDNFVTKIYADIACTQEIMLVDGARYALIQDDYLIFWKASSVELYDIRTKKLVHTIYLV
jgi:hypothetical protein